MLISDFEIIHQCQKPHQKHTCCWKAKLLKNEKEFHQNWWSKGSKFTSRNHVFVTYSSHNLEHTAFRIVKNQLVFIIYSPHCFAKPMIKKWLKATARLTIHRSCQKTTQNEKCPYFIILCAISPPRKRKRSSPDTPQKPPKTPPELSKGPPLHPKGSKEPSKSPWGSRWGTWNHKIQ